MPGLLPDIDPDGLLEFSVVFTDRSLNHMSQKFQGVMNDISTTLKRDAIKANLYRMRRAIADGVPGLDVVLRT